MKLILKRSGAVIKGANKLVFLSLLFFCFTSHAQAQCSITPNNATTCFASGVFNFSYTTTGNPDQYTLATGLRSMPGFSPITDAITSLNTIFIPTSAVPGVYDFTIVVTNTTTPCTSIAATFTLTIFAPPTLGVTAGIGPVCVGSNIVLTAAPSNLVTYTWVSTPGSTIPAVFDPAVTVNEITTYTVTGTDANGCFARR